MRVVLAAEGKPKILHRGRGSMSCPQLLAGKTICKPHLCYDRHTFYNATYLYFFLMCLNFSFSKMRIAWNKDEQNQGVKTHSKKRAIRILLSLTSPSTKIPSSFFDFIFGNCDGKLHLGWQCVYHTPAQCAHKLPSYSTPPAETTEISHRNTGKPLRAVAFTDTTF